MNILGSENSLGQVANGEQGEVAGFIMKTFQILKVQEYQKIIYWAPNGLQFVIKDTQKLQQIILPRFFRHNKINSFVRQLNMYGFHKIKHNNFKSTFRHQSFQKDRDDLLYLIRRKPKTNDRELEQSVCEEIKLPTPQPEKPAPFQMKHQELSTMHTNKWANISQQFLFTTKMINLSLVKVSCNDLAEITNLFAVEDEDCVSIEDEMENESKQQQNAQLFTTAFQNPTFFFSSQFDL